MRTAERDVLGNPTKLVVAHADRKAQRALQRLVGATRLPVTIVETVDALRAAVDEHTIAIVDSALATSEPALREHPARAWIAVPGDGSGAAPAEHVDALLAASWAHVIAQPMPLLAEELLATIQKLARRDVFGLEKYVAWGAEVRGYDVADGAGREAAVAALAADVVTVGLPDRVSSMASVIADELIANARGAAVLRWATDARYLAIEVRDRRGALDAAAIPARLASGAKQQAAEADGGMGLPLAYACCHQLVIGVAPEAMTEVIALLDVRYKPTELAKAASFHAFLGGSPIPA